MFTFTKPRSRKRCKPCHCLASANNPSTQMLRLRIALFEGRRVPIVLDTLQVLFVE